MLEVKNLEISFGEGRNVVKKVSFQLRKNQILGIVGESGSGKSVTSLSILGLLPKKVAQVGGEILFENKNILSCSERELQKIRGNKISMIFQEPMSSLNPTLSCGYQVAEVLRQHTRLSSKEIQKEVLSLFSKVKLPHVERIYRSYPHQISGGQKQRVMIAMAIACKPDLLIADEPTTALDVTVQKEILSLLKELQQENGMSILLITHDLALVSEISDTVLVMYQGKVVERGAAFDVFKNPTENYTKALLRSKPSLTKRLVPLPTVQDFMEGTFQENVYTSVERAAFHRKIYEKPPLLEIREVKKYFGSSGSFWRKKQGLVKAVDGVTLDIYEGETLGLVGESGCGKTTLARILLQLEKASSGHLLYKGTDITSLRKKEWKNLRREIQMIFQDPFSSLNPRIPVGNAILEPMAVHGIFDSKKERKAFVVSLLQKVGLEETHFYRYPHEFSGGQRQRIGIARALALQPKLIICDESVSALDVSVQAQVLNLLNQLKAEHHFTYLFISHDLSVVKYMADQLAVMNKGTIEELGDADVLYKAPKKAYTKKLLEAIPKGMPSSLHF